MPADDRVALLERRTEDLSERLVRLENAAAAPTPAACRSPRQTPGGDERIVVGRERTDATPTPPRPQPISWDLTRLEGLVGGRLIAWLGGIAVVLGLALLASVAISHGWLGPVARTVAAAALAGGLVIAGLRVGDRRLSIALLAAGIGSGFVAACLAGPVHHLVPAAVAGLLALGVGAVGVVLAVRREARGIAALGILGGLAAPLMTASEASTAAAVLILVAAASAAAVLVWQRWDWLRAGLVLLALPQLAVPASLGDTPLPLALGSLALLGVILAIAAIGFEVRAGGTRPAPISAALLLAGAAGIAAAGWSAAVTHDHHTVGQLWLVAIAAAHLGAGIALLRVARRGAAIHPDVPLLLIAIGWVLADLAAASLLHGLVLGLLWAVSAGFAAVLARRAGADHERLLAVTGLTGQLVLALGSALITVPPDRLLDGGTVQGSVLLGAVVITAALAARVLPADRLRFPLNTLPGILDVVALATLAYLTISLAQGTALVVALAAQAVALDVLARHGASAPARLGALGFLAMATAAGLVSAIPPDALIAGFDDPAGAAVALAALAAATFAIARRTAHPRSRLGLQAGAALALLDLGSGLVVTALPGDEIGQVAVSVLWAVGGLLALIAGLRTDRQAPRVAGLALLLVAAGKVFLVDLATLTSLARVASFVAIGLLLLLAASAWQRVRTDAGPGSAAHPPTS